MGPYQPAPDAYFDVPGGVVLWALHGYLHQIEREIPETKSRKAWESKLDKAIMAPVQAFPWKTLWQTFALPVVKDDRDAQVPSKVTDAWAGIPDLVHDLWLEAGKERADRLELPFNPEDLDAAMAETMQLVTSIPDVLHERLREIMRDAYEKQDGQFGFARQIRTEFGAVSKQRAELIATTEWNRAASQATLIGYTAQGVALKVWYTVGDERVCPTCDQNSADLEIPIGQPFFSGDMAPPAHPGCRCDIAAG